MKKNIEKIQYETLIGYLIGGFDTIKNVQDFLSVFENYLNEISEEPIVKTTNSVLNTTIPGNISSYSFVFYPPDNLTWGIVDLDFLNKGLVNTKVQLIDKYPSTTFSRMHIKQKMSTIINSLKYLFGESKLPSEFKELDKYRVLFQLDSNRFPGNNLKLWQDPKKELFLYLNNGFLSGLDNVEYFSLSITNQKYL